MSVVVGGMEVEGLENVHDQEVLPQESPASRGSHCILQMMDLSTGCTSP